MQRCPEWTDHNVSDPGVTLIETFAYMTDLLLYRLNRVPDRLYVKFLELIGLRLFPPTAARTDVTFWLSAPAEGPLVIPAGTNVATLRSEQEEPVVFSTNEELRVVGCSLQAVATEGVGTGQQVDQTDRLHLRASFAAFSPVPVAGDTFLIALSDGVPRVCGDVAVRLLGRRHRCRSDQSATHLGSVVGRSVGALRGRPRRDRRSQPCRRSRVARSAVASARGVERSPSRLVAGAGPAVGARRAVVHVVAGDPRVAGVDGRRHHRRSARGVGARRDLGRVGRHRRASDSPRNARRSCAPANALRVHVTTEQGWEEWTEVEHFAASGPDDRHFVVDAVSAEICFGPGRARGRRNTAALRQQPAEGCVDTAPELRRRRRAPRATCRKAPSAR